MPRLPPQQWGSDPMKPLHALKAELLANPAVRAEYDAMAAAADLVA